jgi:hypothetical protein
MGCWVSAGAATGLVVTAGSDDIVNWKMFLFFDIFDVGLFA